MRTREESKHLRTLTAWANLATTSAIEFAAIPEIRKAYEEKAEALRWAIEKIKAN